MFQGLLSVTHGLNSPCSHCVLPTRWPLFGNWTRGLYKCHGDLQPMRLGRSELGKSRNSRKVDVGLTSFLFNCGRAEAMLG